MVRITGAKTHRFRRDWEPRDTQTPVARSVLFRLSNLLRSNEIAFFEQQIATDDARSDKVAADQDRTKRTSSFSVINQHQHHFDVIGISARLAVRIDHRMGMSKRRQLTNNRRLVSDPAHQACTRLSARSNRPRIDSDAV